MGGVFVAYGLLFAFLTAVCWGFSPILQKQALKNMGLLELNAARGAGVLAALMLMPLVTGTETLRLGLDRYPLVAAIALSNNVIGDLFLFAAIRHIGVSLASPITSSYPLIVAVFSRLWFREELTPFVVGGTLSVVTGLALLNFRGKQAAAGTGRHLRGVVFAASGAFFAALGFTLNKYLAQNGVSASALTFWKCLTFVFISFSMWAASLPGHPGRRSHLKEIPASAWLAGAGAGIVALLVGGWFYAASLFSIPLSVATPIASSSPLIAALLACALMGERLRPLQWLGIVFIVSGAVLVGTR